ncbi:MAG TPA: CPBP family glutamic-type intramembrane protease [Armatimonadota bacterium]|jgi:hypothetical protein
MTAEQPPEPVVFAAPSDPHRGRTALAFVLAAIFLIGGALAYRSVGQSSNKSDSGLSSVFKGDLLARSALGVPTVSRPGKGSQWREAEACYRAAVKSSPRMARARRSLAAVAWLRGDRKRAAEVMQAPVDIPPGRRDVWLATQAAYGAIPRPADAKTLIQFKSALRSKDLGWSRFVALQALASTAAESQRVGREMQESSRPMRTTYLVLGLMALLGFMVGLVFLGFFIAQPQCDRLPRLNVPAWSFGAAFLLGIAAQNAVGYPMRSLMGKHLDSGGEGAAFAALLAVYTLGAAVAAGLAHLTLKRNGSALSALGWAPRGAVGHAISGYLALLPVLALAGVVSTQGARLFPNVETPMNSAEWMAAGAHGWSLVPLFLTVCVVGPWVEELLFRGLLFRALQSSFGFWGGAILSSAAFAALHPQLPLGFLPIWCIGIGLCVLYRRSGSLTACWILHGINNTVALVFSVATFGHLGPLW